MGGRAAALLIFLFAATTALPAHAQTVPFVLPAENAPVVRVMMRSGMLTVRTWNRGDVQVASAQPFSARSFRPEAVARALNGTFPINATSVVTPGGIVTLPAEEFALSSLSGGPHDGILVQAQDANITLMLPQNTALLLANVQRGFVDVRDYHNGTFVALVHNGGIGLRNVSGTGYAEVARGLVLAGASSFEHLRARTAVGNILFEACDSKQIEVSSVLGTIVYDNGSFQPGLARFESEFGNVAVGVGGGSVQIGAHSSVGRIFSNFDGPSPRLGQVDARIGNGATVVTASASHGAVFVYGGALRSQPRLGAEWTPLRRLVQRRGPPPPKIPARHVH